MCGTTTTSQRLRRSRVPSMEPNVIHIKELTGGRIIMLCLPRKMTIDQSKAVGKSEYNGKTYYFCAASCKTKFDANPSAYVRQS